MESSPQPAPSRSRLPAIVALAAGVMLVGFGLWAMASPSSFFDALATFEPYNRHFLQDIGAFQIGLGAVLILATRTADSLVSGLGGVGIGSTAHVVSHAVGVDLGGSPALDIPFFSVLSLVLLAAAAVRWRESATTPGRGTAEPAPGGHS